MDHQGVSLPAHVLIFPVPTQGHVNSMLKLGELLCLADVQVTFLVFDDIHDRLLRYTNIRNRFACYPGFRFESISDGVPAESSRSDGILSFALEVAEELGIPIIYIRTACACSFWSYFSIPQLIEAGELPFKGNDLDVPIQSISGMESFLRLPDLPN